MDGDNETEEQTLRDHNAVDPNEVKKSSPGAAALAEAESILEKAKRNPQVDLTSSLLDPGSEDESQQVFEGDPNKTGDFVPVGSTKR